MSTSQQTLETTLIMEDSTSPITLGGVAAPVGSYLTAEDGSGFFYKSGAADLDWEQFAYVNDPTFTGTVTIDSVLLMDAQTASRIAIIDASKNLISADTATYPSLTELSYVKGVTSSIQDQIDNLGTYIFLTGGDQSTTSASATAITDLVTPTLEANSRYVIYGHIHLGCDNTGGVLFACDIPSGSVFLTYIGRTNSGTAFRQIANAVDATLFTGAFNTFNNANGGVAIFGEITTGVTAGTSQLMFASGTAGQTSTIYQLGTYLFIKKIA